MKKSVKIHYEVDPHNRLVKVAPKANISVSGFRKVIDGRFSLGDKNTLIYHIKKSGQQDIPQELKLSGRWSLDKNHNLIFTLDKWGNQVEGDKLVIKGEIISVSGEELAVSLLTRDSSGKTGIYILKLSGIWRADRFNRIAFSVDKERGAQDILTFVGAWSLNDNNEIIYTYKKEALKRKKKLTKIVAFKGYWDINDKYRISYILNKELKSGFDFKVAFEKAGSNFIEYQAGIGSSLRKKEIILFGKWVLNRALGILFEINYSGGRIKTISFGATLKIDKNWDTELNLKNREGKELGIEVKLSRKLIGSGGEAFIKAASSSDEKAIALGAGFRW